MKKRWLLIISLVVVFVFLFCACNRDGETEAPETTGAETGEVTDKMTMEEAKREALRILIPTSKDAFVLNDDVVYTWGDINGEILYRWGKVPGAGREFPVSSQYLWRYREEEEPQLICRVEGCEHNDIRCPGLAWNILFTLTSEESGETIVYYLVEVRMDSVPVGGYFVNVSSELGINNTGQSMSRYVLFEYNLTTGVRRCVTADYPAFSGMDFYYNGKIYTNFTEDRSDDGGYNWYDFNVLACVDAVTSEVTYYEKDGEQIYVAGIYDGAIYGMTPEGSLVKISPDLHDREVIGIVDENFAVFHANEYGGGWPLGVLSMQCAFINGYLYICMDNQPEEVAEWDDNLYRYALSGEEEAERIADDVRYIYGYGDYVYYFDDLSEPFVHNGNIMYNDGTLYRYNTVTGETETVFEGNGISIDRIYYVDDERIIFDGTLLQETVDGYEPEDPTRPHVYVEYVFATGKRNIICATTVYTP